MAERGGMVVSARGSLRKQRHWAQVGHEEWLRAGMVRTGGTAMPMDRLDDLLEDSIVPSSWACRIGCALVIGAVVTCALLLIIR